MYKAKDPKFIPGKRRRVMIDLPLPKAAESRSLEGIYPKWPNFPKIVLWRPKGGKSGKPKQNNKHTAQTGCASELRSHFSQQSARSRATAARPGRQAAPRRAPPHTCLGRGPSRRLPVAALADATTLQLRSPPKSNHIQASDCRSPVAGAPEAATLLHPGDCTGFLQQPEVG